MEEKIQENKEDSLRKALEMRKVLESAIRMEALYSDGKINFVQTSEMVH